jgi:hypothetical protein
MIHKFSTTSLLILVSAIWITACKKNNAPPVNEEELITSVTLTFVDVTDGTAVTFAFRDPDGEGGNPPTQFDEIELKAGRFYQCSIALQNESLSPAKDITEEVEEESADHQFYHILSGVSTIVSNLDTDTNGLPLGIHSTWDAGSASSGTVKIVLKHKPGEKAAGDPVSKGETDIELDFAITIN